MFFGPSKDNQKAASIIDFYTKNVVGDVLVEMVKNDSEIIKSISNNLSLPTWTKAAQLAAVSYIYTSLSNSKLRGKEKLMEIMADNIKSQSNFSLAEMMNTYTYFNQQMISLLEKNGPQDRTEKQILMIFGEIVISNINGKRSRTIDEIMEQGTQIKELFTIGNKVITPFMGYFR